MVTCSGFPLHLLPSGMALNFRVFALMCPYVFLERLAEQLWECWGNSNQMRSPSHSPGIKTSFRVFSHVPRCSEKIPQ